MRRCFVLMGLAILAAAPALPDVIDVTVNGSVSGSGTVLVACNPMYTAGCMQYGGGPYSVYLPYSFSGTNTQLSGGTPPEGTGYAEENTSLCTGCGPLSIPGVTTFGGDDLDVQLTGGHSAVGYSYFAEEAADVSISFDLTEESVVTLFKITLRGSSSSELLDPNGNVILSLTMDGAASTILLPGAYQLDDAGQGSSFGAFPEPGDVIDLNQDMYAEFAPVPTPEPRGAVFGALALMLLAFPLLRRRCVR